jgi:hypothetical protein
MHKGLKWFARISGLVVSVFFGAFFIGGGGWDMFNGTEGNVRSFIFFCIPAITGFIYAWFKPYIGGLIMILGALLLGSYFVYYGDFNMSMIFGVPALLIGLSFVASVHKELV